MIKAPKIVLTVCAVVIIASVALIATNLITGCNSQTNNYSQISADAANDTIDGIQKSDAMQQINCNIESSLEYARLAGEIETIKANGKKVGFIMLDIKSCKGVAYNIDFPWCSQSTIKAPYVASLLDWDPNVWAYWGDKITDIITLSDDQSYNELRDYYGNVQFAEFLQSAGVDARYAQVLYPRDITVREMAKIWTKMFGVLNSTDDLSGTMSKFAECFEHTAHSSTQDVIGRKYKTHCKAGWEEGIGYNEDGTLTSVPIPRMIDGDPSNDEISTNDTGIVYAGDNPYLLVSFTNFAANESHMFDFAEAIDDLHDVITAQNSE